VNTRVAADAFAFTIVSLSFCVAVFVFFPVNSLLQPLVPPRILGSSEFPSGGSSGRLQQWVCFGALPLGGKPHPLGEGRAFQNAPPWRL
jgi:hypothetical protein